MAVDSSLLQILNSLPIEDKEAMRIGSASTVTSTNEFDVIGSLSTNGTTVIRRLPFNSNLKKLDDWKETAGVVFHRFLQDKSFFFSFAGIILTYFQFTRHTKKLFLKNFMNDRC
jgi:hypothetical protein